METPGEVWSHGSRAASGSSSQAIVREVEPALALPPAPSARARTRSSTRRSEQPELPRAPHERKARPAHLGRAPPPRARRPRRGRRRGWRGRAPRGAAAAGGGGHLLRGRAGPHHWNGVNALGTSTATEMETDTPLLGPRPTTSRPISSTRSARRRDADDVLVGLRGQPHHEVELHPAPPRHERVAAPRDSTSSSVTFLLMTSRRRWLPASGAKVRPPPLAPRPRPPPCPPRRRPGAATGMETRTPPPRQRDVQAAEDLRALRVVGRGERRERDLVVPARGEKTLQPAARTTCSAGRSRTGPVRHPRLAEAAAARAAAQHLQRQSRSCTIPV